MSKVYTIDDELADVLWVAAFFNCTSEIVRMLQEGTTMEKMREVLKPHHDRMQRLSEEAKR